MSLILEALRKLDREKTAGAERGFVVVAASPWRTREGLRSWRVLPWLVTGGALVALAVVLVRRPGPPAAVAPVPAADRDLVRPGVAPASEPPAALPQALAKAPVLAATIGSTPPAAAARPSPAPSDPAPLVLEAISSRDGRPVAIVSGRLVREGDSFDGVRIVRIGDDRVEVERDGRRLVLRF